ncbi:DVU_1553 family AMP-dependent CoA ligase [Desulfatitalea tepidiphila]|uniref:DVU_1553 family AMP-dependent CoA ligase n=1 Tax=Desulfatitalea tepidiphila TaxID=1185843 RepID=UPI0006B53D2F|nr:AMP-binding protein [Desulfatitalea tepidiphila]
MIPIARTPLEDWAVARIGLTAHQPLEPELLSDYQLERLNQTLARAARSPYYRRQWEGLGIPRLDRIDELRRLPFTPSDVLRREPLELVCGSQGAVARVVTLHSSGTTGDPKRIFFDEEDLERTVDFFHHGMTTLVKPGQRVLILLPGELPDSVGDLLRRALARMNAVGLAYGLVQDPRHAIQAILDLRIDALVGIPVQVLALARHEDRAWIAPGTIQSVLLSTDYVPRAIVSCIREAWHCPVFQHYGMTEMGYGGALACGAHDGYHLREADLLFEVVDPVTHEPIDHGGRPGEIVFTTLTRYTMPLIRYRTGDLASWIDGPCPCGATLRRMGWVQGRLGESVRLSDGVTLDLASLDEALFALPDVLNFQATLKTSDGQDALQVRLMVRRRDTRLPPQADAALRRVPAVRAALANGSLVLAPISMESGAGLTGPAAKRKIVVERE